MIKKILATAAVVTSIVGVSAGPAMAIGDDHGGNAANGNGSEQRYGNTTTGGYMSPQIGLVQGTLNKPCVAVPIKDVQVVAGLALGVQDLLAQNGEQTCAENSSFEQGDAPLSHILDNIPVLSGNGVGNH
ncbi:rodlin [Streptantibioticus ferralitis]|uniref:Rodlin n=1 Tax=Streptantibioticus ferralitis TaxID=236510 RepID=A0ABT5Z2G4_9ACTN|nr:rodlin [Streptantibioticus ferralitis]MDF2258034.1 rodlin [Streptantibioticus ferralitis]